MTALRDKAAKVADMLTEFAVRDPRRGVVVETVLATKLADQDVLVAETLEVLSHRVAALSAPSVSPIAQKLKASYLADLTSETDR